MDDSEGEEGTVEAEEGEGEVVGWVHQEGLECGDGWIRGGSEAEAEGLRWECGGACGSVGGA